MLESLSTPLRRISIALTFSVLIHILILWLPYIQWQHTKVFLPPLTVHLELLPAQEMKAEAPTTTEVQPELVTKENTTAAQLSEKSATNTVTSMKKLEKLTSTQQFPKHLQLTFVVYKGENLLRTGTIRHQLDIQNDKYSLYAVRDVIGLTNLTVHDQVTQASRGQFGEHGFKPDTFQEVNNSADGMQQDVTFDWANHVLHATNGDDVTLPAEAQDALSFMYQLSQLSLKKEIVTLYIGNGKGLENVEMEIGRAEETETKMGPVSALHLRKIHKQGEAYFEIWLGVEFRLFPVKFRQFDSTGAMTEELILSDIRALDE